MQSIETFQEAKLLKLEELKPLSDFVTDAGHIRGIQIKHSKTNGEMSNNEKPQPLPQCKQIPLARSHCIKAFFVCS